MDDGNDRTTEEDDVTEPGTATDADRAEQDELLDPPEVSLAGDAAAPPADVLEQETDVPVGEDSPEL